MRRKIIVTGLTRFGQPDIVCIAGVDPSNGECIRPMPYWMQANGIYTFPGHHEGIRAY